MHSTLKMHDRIAFETLKVNEHASKLNGTKEAENFTEKRNRKPNHIASKSFFFVKIAFLAQ